MKYFFLVFFVLWGSTLWGQTYRITGIILEKDSHEPIPYATCFDSINKIGTNADENGRFSLLLPKGRVHLQISCAGYFKRLESFNLTRDTLITFYIEPILLDEITIIANEESLFAQALSGKTYIPSKKINNLPSFAGQPDIIKSLVFIPGVSTGKEGKSDLYVRGGSKDQNLFLMDDAIIYNPYHVGGFITGINNEIIKSIDFYKGGFPARYGGRSSSILDVQLKEGHKKQWHGKIMFGLVNSGFILEGPIKKEKTSVIIAFRSSYFDLFNLEKKRNFEEAEKMPFALNNFTPAETFNFTFFDFNFKVDHMIDNKNKVYCNVYSGNDYFFSGEIRSNGYGALHDKTRFNTQSFTAACGHHLYLMSGKLLKTSISLSRYLGNFYQYTHSIQWDEDGINTKNSADYANDFTLKSQLVIDYNRKHSIRTGIQNSFYTYQPGKIREINENIIAHAKSDTTYEFKGENRMNELSLFIEDEIKLNPKVQINIGLRNTAVFTIKKTYLKIEPRLSYRQLLNEKTSVKASYTLTHQYLQALTDNSYGLEREIWVGSTSKIAPAYVHQFAVGLYGQLNVTGVEFGIEPFYKKMGNLIYYTPTLVWSENLYDDWENIVAREGKGESYGTEFIIQKRTDNFTSSLAYTLSWNYRQFKQLNDGQRFPFLYDKRHDVNFILQYDLSKMYSISLNFSFNSGARVTLPVAYVPSKTFFPDYMAFGPINNGKLPPYHRLDLMTQKHWKSKKGFIQHFNVNIFNVYARKNPVYIYVSNGKVYKKSFFSIIPTISYGIEF